MAFIDRFISGIYPAERKVVPRNFQPVAIVARKPGDTKVNVADSSTTEVKEVENVVEDTKDNSIVCVARLVALKPNTQHHVLVTTKSDGLLTIDPRTLRLGRQYTLAVRTILDVSPG